MSLSSAFWMEHSIGNMMAHPVLIAVAVLDVISFAVVLTAAVTAFRTLLNWNPGSADTGQILLERKTEVAAIAGRFGLTAFIFASTLLLIGISNMLPKIIPGAMCGTGVCQAADGLFGRAIMFRLSAMAVFVVWLGIDRLNRTLPHAPLTLLAARVLLIGIPFQLISLADTLRGSLAVDVRNPVDCCTLVYEQLNTGAAVERLFMFSETSLVWAFISLSGLLLTFGAAVVTGSRFRNTSTVALLGILSVLWVPVAVTTLIQVFSAYIYGVLQHQCPWCLFLAEHHFIGFLLFFCVAVVGLEGLFGWIAAGLRANYPELEHACSTRIRRAALRVTVSAVLFCFVAGLPAVLWRVRYGVWIFG